MAPKRLDSAGALDTIDLSPAREPQASLYAALDLGTNSCRMLIARPDGAGFRVVDSFSKSVQLGLGLERTGRLGREPMHRTIHALNICRRKLAQHQVKKMCLVATEACRRARNGKEFIERVYHEIGLKLTIIPPREEARLAVISCAPLVDVDAENLLVVDIGGGSTELVWVDLSDVPAHRRPQAIMGLSDGIMCAGEAPEHHARVVDWISVPLGVATLRDQFMDVEDDRARFALMSYEFEEKLSGFVPYGHDMLDESFQIIGTSGTVTTVAASYLGLKRYDRTQVDGLRMTSDQINAVIRSYLAMGPAGRQADPRIGPGRQTMIMSGAAILQALLRCWPAQQVRVADRGLREGLLYAQMISDRALNDAMTGKDG